MLSQGSGFMWEYQTLRHLRRNWWSRWHQRHKTSVGQVKYVGSGFSATGGRKICQICTSVSSHQSLSHQRWSRLTRPVSPESHLTRSCLTRVSFHQTLYQQRHHQTQQDTMSTRQCISSPYYNLTELSMKARIRGTTCTKQIIVTSSPEHQL